MPVPDPYESETFLAAIISSSDDAILSKNLQGIITSWNEGAERLFGYTAEEAVGRSVTLLFPPDRIDEEPEILARVQRGERVGHYETIRRRKDGGLIQISLTVSPIRDANGVVVGASKIARDITAQRQAQELHRVTLASIGDAVISTDRDGRITFLNAIAAGLTGWSDGTAVGRPVAEVFAVVDELSRQPVAIPVTVALQGDDAALQSRHMLLLGKDGRQHPIECRAAPIRRGTGDVAGAVLIFRDVRARRLAELASRRLAAIVEGSDDAIVSKDLRGVVTSWNPGAERIFGYTEAEMIGQPITRVIPEDRQAEEPDILSRFQRGERVDHFETVRQRKDGTLIHVSLTVSPIRDDEGRIVGASKIARDITALKQAQESLARHARDLEDQVAARTAELRKMVSELEAFSFSLSHDLRAPLRSIRGFSEIVLSQPTERTPKAADYLQKVVNAAGRMERLIDDVLSFTRVSHAQLKVTPLDVEALLSAILEDRPELQAPQVLITIVLPLPQVAGNEASLTQCLSNLLHNAVKFVPAGVVPEVHIYAADHGEHVRLCVEDNGIGIAPEALPSLFNVFHRLNPAQRYPGSGLGLAIVRKATERMNGRVGVESTPGRGSTFWLELPRVAAGAGSPIG